METTTEVEELMASIFIQIETVQTNWANMTKGYQKASALRIRKALDTMASAKIDLRKEMMKIEKKAN